MRRVEPKTQELKISDNYEIVGRRTFLGNYQLGYENDSERIPILQTETQSLGDQIKQYFNDDVFDYNEELEQLSLGNYCDFSTTMNKMGKMSNIEIPYPSDISKDISTLFKFKDQ